MTTRYPWLGLGLVLLVLALPASSAPRRGVDEWIPRDDPWRARLEALRPVDPLAYFELGEEIAHATPEWRDVELAQTLFGLAGLLDRTQLGRSACLALADLSVEASERRRLRALAAILGGAGLGGRALPSAQARNELAAGMSDDTVIAVLNALSYYRRGNGAKAIESLEAPEAMELLGRCDALLPGGVQRFVEDCRHYRGQLRPLLDDNDILRMLQIEVALLAGEDQRWSTAATLARLDPLIEVDPERLGEALGADPSRPYFRRSGWVAAP